MILGGSLVRHQAGAIAATVVDYSLMIALVSEAGAAPEVGTAVGAACGGITNFVLGRRWVFRATQHDAAIAQARRYAVVSLGGLLLNTAGMHVLASLMHLPYVGARVVVSLFVSVLWNFPMQRTFVFGASTK
jgi:putative flippase GtrA